MLLSQACKGNCQVFVTSFQFSQTQEAKAEGFSRPRSFPFVQAHVSPKRLSASCLLTVGRFPAKQETPILLPAVQCIPYLQLPSSAHPFTHLHQLGVVAQHGPGHMLVVLQQVVCQHRDGAGHWKYNQEGEIGGRV